MLRSRAKQSISFGDDHDHAKQKQNHSQSVVYHTKTRSHQLIPVWLQVTIVVAVLLLGYSSQHYNMSRSRDPFHAHSIQVLTHLERRGSKSAPSQTFGSSVLTGEEDNELEFDDGQRYHVIFSTDCSPYQHWQRYV
jgi:hypothetical protein